MGFGRSSVHKILLEGSGDCSSIPSSMAKNLGEAFAAKSMFVDFTEVVIIPQLVVDGMEGGEDDIYNELEISSELRAKIKNGTVTEEEL